MDPSSLVRPVAVRAPSSDSASGATSGAASPARGSPSPSRSNSSVPGTASPRPKHKREPSTLRTPRTLVVGVVGIQGAFREHMTHLTRAGRLIESDAEAAYLAAGRKKQDVTAHKDSVACENIRVTSRLVRSPEDLEGLNGLIIPGGESTAIALGMQRAGLLEPIRQWVSQDRPTWGTCAGMILLSREASAGKRGGQELIGGIDARIERNGYGSQTASFETSLAMPELGPEPFPAVFIRAPILDCLLDPDTPSPYVPMTKSPDQEDVSISRTSLPVNIARPLPSPLVPGSRPPIQILGSLESPVALPPESHVHPAYALPREEDSTRSITPRPVSTYTSSSPTAQPNDKNEKLIGTRPEYDAQIVALRQGNLMATSFHPELTTDARLHKYFITHIVSSASQ